MRDRLQKELMTLEEKLRERLGGTPPAPRHQHQLSKYVEGEGPMMA
jgi:hypothetical protein